MMNTITHVAVKYNGTVYSMPAPYRHHNVICKIVNETGDQTVNALGEDQGFLDSSGAYLTRKEALDLALSNGQLRTDRPIYDQLYSENLW